MDNLPAQMVEAIAPLVETFGTRIFIPVFLFSTVSD